MVNLFWLAKPQIVHRSVSATVSSAKSTLEFDYSLCAQQHIDSHVIKIALEATQLLYNAHHSSPISDDWREKAPETKGGNKGYRAFNLNNPISVWIRSNIQHYRHAVSYGLALCEEYTYRYEKVHSCEPHLRWLKENEPNLPSHSTSFCSPPCTMPEQYSELVIKKSITKPLSARRKRKAVDNNQTAPPVVSNTVPPTDPNYFHFFSDEIYKSYKNYYLGEKLTIKMSKWTKRPTPEWVQEFISKNETPKKRLKIDSDIDD